MLDHTPTSRADELLSAIRERYAGVAREPLGQFAYPVGLESLHRLGYAPDWISSIPRELASRFVGVGNPLAVRRPQRGERVLDVGCGCGVDTLIAANLVGPTGRSVGLDATPEMLAWPRSARGPADGCAPEFVDGSVEDLPFDDRSFDVVVSNGALNLATDKDRAFAEIARVLRLGGEMAVADLIVKEAIPEEVLANMDAWCT